MIVRKLDLKVAFQAALETGLDAGTAFAENIIGPAQEAARGIDRNMFAMFMSSKDLGEDIDVDLGMKQGADFGDVPPGSEPVVLQVEICSSRETKFAGFVSSVVALIVTAFMIILVVLKTTWVRSLGVVFHMLFV